MRDIARTITLTLLICFGFGQLNEAPAELPEKENFHLFLLVGQSNMAGRGKLDEAAKVPHPRVMMLSKENKWVPATDPLHFDKPGIVGVGLGRSFAEVMAKADSEITIGLIPCAVGGSPISSWQPNQFYRPTKSHPWDDAVRRAHIALKDGTLKGILWHQGESDSKTGLAEDYEHHLHDLISRFRKEFNTPEVPFLVGQMGQFPERPWNDAKRMVNTAHETIAEHVPFTVFVNSNQLGHKGDEVHFNTAAYRELGRRYAEGYQRLINQDQSSE